MVLKNALMFGSSDCKACLTQIAKFIKHYGNDPNRSVMYYDLKRKKPPDFILDKDGTYTMPTWVLKNGKIIKGVINDKNMFDELTYKVSKTSFGKKRKPVKRKTVVKRKPVKRKPVKRKTVVKSLCKNGVCPLLRKNKFGECLQSSVVPQIDSLVQCGKNFPNGEGFNIPNSWSNTIKDKWGSSDYLTAGTVGRELGPGNTDKIFSNSYYNDIRMAPPGGQLATALGLNRACSVYNGVNKNMETPGLIYNSPNPQIVGPGFGSRRKKRSGFGNLYSQMGKAYGSQYLMGKDTVNNLGGGSLSDNKPRLQRVPNKNIFIGQAKEYNPINGFGRKVSEGSVINISKGKITIK